MQGIQNQGPEWFVGALWGLPRYLVGYMRTILGGLLELAPEVPSKAFPAV